MEQPIVVADGDRFKSAFLEALREEFRKPEAAPWRAAFCQAIKCTCERRLLVEVPFTRVRDHSNDCPQHPRRDVVEFRMMPAKDAIPFLAAEAEAAWIRPYAGRRNANHEIVEAIWFSLPALTRALCLDELPIEQQTRVMHRAVAKVVAAEARP